MFLRKPIFIFSVLFLIVLSSIAQNKKFNSNNLYSIASSVKHNGDWLRFDAEMNLTALTLLSDNKTLFGLSDKDDLKLVRTEEDDLGLVHYRFQQMYKSLPVEGAEYFIHSRNGIALSGNGRLTREININTTPAISPAEAIQRAKEFSPAQKYLWEDEGAEQMLKNIRKDSKATFYPSPELVITPIDFSNENSEKRLAYKMNIYANEPLIGKTIYVDAVDGKILFTMELIQTSDVPATAVTKYSGIQTITTDSVSPNLYRLRETGRAGGVETYNARKLSTYGTAIDFTDNNNYWDTVNTLQDEAATDAHWATEKTYDYFMQKHNRNSFDNNGTKLVSYIHYAITYTNAFWNGSWMTYGDGNFPYRALTSIDIGGHEITHGVTQNSSGLFYQNESGALNESFSDIFGTCIEFYAKPAAANWLMSDDISFGQYPFRSMSNPNSRNDPDTYKGTYYYNGTADYGGVHTNSGVQNFWFYVLTVGDTGTNDLGKSYQVAGLGMSKAEKIAYRNLTIYLGKNSRYIDAREGAICAAEDLYGICSDEALQTSQAWYAVGVGEPIGGKDVRLMKIIPPISKCGLTASENVTFLMRNRSCTTFSAGDSIFATYRLDTLTITTDTILLASPMAPGDSLYYTFTKLADFSLIKLHSIDGWINSAGDTHYFNDTIKGLYVNNSLYQNTDIAISSISSPKSGCFLSSTEKICARVQFRGCDSLPANERFVLGYSINNGPAIKDSVMLKTRILPYGIYSHTFSATADFSNYQSYSINCWVEYAQDVKHNNDSIFNYRINRSMDVRDSLISFEDTTSAKNLFYSIANPSTRVYFSPGAAHTSNFGLRMTGKDWINKRTGLKFPTDLNTWTVNDDYLAKACICVDASDWSQIVMHFDRRQTFIASFVSTFAYNTNVTSNLRVTVGGTQVSPTYRPFTGSADPWVKDSIILDSYAGTFFTVCFETKNYMAGNYEITPGPGDNAFLDNIYFTGVVKPEIPLEIFNVYPNPANNNFTIAYGTLKTEMINIKVVDMLGREMINMDRSVGAGNNYIPFNQPTWGPGVYVVQIRTEEVRMTKSIVIE